MIMIETGLVSGSAPSVASPERVFETLVAYQRTAALKAAIELDIFTAIGSGQSTIPSIAQLLIASERAVRILCDSLVVIGFLTKTEPAVYRLTPEAALFLDKRSHAYIGSAAQFLTSAMMMDGFRDMTSVVHTGQTRWHRPFAEADHPIWSEFARSMGPLSYVVSRETAKLFDSELAIRVLDVGAGHGFFGIAVAQRNAKASIVACDWPSVLEIAQENARRAGVSERFTALPGDALKVDFGTGFDAMLLPNLLHMWDRPTIEHLLRKVFGALKKHGRVIVVELAPNDDRTSPPIPALFALNMLANTSGGDAYTASEYRAMLASAGFPECEIQPLPTTSHTAIIGRKRK